MNILSGALAGGEFDCVHVDLEEQSWMVGSIRDGEKEPFPPPAFSQFSIEQGAPETPALLA